MKNFKNFLHLLVTIASLAGFLGGWATLAHSRKPTQPGTTQVQVVEPLPQLDPIPDLGITLGEVDNNNLNIIVPPSDNSNNLNDLNNSGTVNNQTNSSGSSNSQGSTRKNRSTRSSSPSNPVSPARPVIKTSGS